MSGLRDRFRSLTRRLGATTDSGPLADALLAAWSAPDRVYHDLRHLEDCLARLDELSLPSSTRDVIETALWFHDAVYDPRAADNEEQSARWAVDALSALGINAAVTGDVARLVHLTRDHAPTSDEPGRLVCDIDLSILGRSAAEFAAYEQRVRAEYAWVPDAAFRRGRRRVLSAFLQRDPLFQTERFRRRFEATARANLQRALATLS